jgi:hypothetical protein
MKLAVIVLACALCAFGQTLPANGAFVGLGFQSVANPQVSGWVEYEKALPDVQIGSFTFHSYGGAATDYSGAVTSGRIDTKWVILRHRWLTFGTLQGGGVAYNSNGYGGSFTGGGWVTAGIGKLLGIPGAVLAMSASATKDDVSIALADPTLKGKLVKLGLHGTFRFGVGKVWD